MDPNANLRQQEDTLLALARATDDSDRAALSGLLAGLRDGLTQWLNRGGFEPRWAKWPIAAQYYRRSTR